MACIHVQSYVAQCLQSRAMGCLHGVTVAHSLNCRVYARVCAHQYCNIRTCSMHNHAHMQVALALVELADSSSGTSWSWAQYNGQPFKLVPQLKWPGSMPPSGTLTVHVVNGVAVNPGAVCGCGRGVWSWPKMHGIALLVSWRCPNCLGSCSGVYTRDLVFFTL